MSFEEVKTEGAKILLMLCGMSGGGKTFTGLQIAKGLAGGDMAKVGFIDSENGRGRLYTNKFATPYMYSEIKAPFSPRHYIQKVEEAEAMGIEVLVIDSFSHEWDDVGGCIWIAENDNPKMPNWNKAKREHKLLMQKLLRSSCHIILCIRGKEKIVQERVEGKMVFRSVGFTPITEKNVIYEATASLIIDNGGLTQTPLKNLPADLVPILGRNSGYLTEEDGVAIKAWVSGLSPSKEASSAKEELVIASSLGVSALKAKWQTLPAYVRYLLGGECPADLKEKAMQADKDASNSTKVANVLDGKTE